jgi:hypothetical protein
VNPFTGEKALHVDQGFTRRIVGFKKEESDFLLNFLFDHISKGAVIRATYEPGTVVVWVSYRLLDCLAVPFLLHNPVASFCTSSAFTAVSFTLVLLFSLDLTYLTFLSFRIICHRSFCDPGLR